MKFRLTRLAAVTLAGCMAASVFGQDFVFESRARQTQFIELFTSEGCGSCPRADAWLSNFVDHHGLWERIVPVAFHVHYQDELGWTDPFASPRYTGRQRQYVSARNMDKLYIPCFIVDGEEWRGRFTGSTYIEPQHALPGKLSVASEDHVLDIEFVPRDPEHTHVTVWISYLGFGLVSKVDAGENQGRRLEHDFVALRTRTETVELEDGRYRAHLYFEPPYGAGAERLGIAVWVTPLNDPGPIQATGGFLP